MIDQIKKEVQLSGHLVLERFKSFGGSGANNPHPQPSQQQINSSIGIFFEKDEKEEEKSPLKILESQLELYKKKMEESKEESLNQID